MAMAVHAGQWWISCGWRRAMAMSMPSMLASGGSDQMMSELDQLRVEKSKKEMDDDDVVSPGGSRQIR
jgi:hypothetical protein